MRIVKILQSKICVSILAVALFATMAAARGDNHPTQPATQTIEGLVRDISCPIQNQDATATTFNLQCALDCAKLGSPLIILDKAGYIYVPISSSMPDTDQRSRLLPFVGKYVKASGAVYERKGTRAIAIASIGEMKGVPLVSDAK